MSNKLVAAVLAVLLASVAPGFGQQGSKRSDNAKPGVEENYKTHCQQCHMADGNSPVELLSFADGKWKQGSRVKDIATVIAEGVKETPMLPFKEKLSQEEILALAKYVRSFDKQLKPGKTAKRSSSP